MTTEDPLLFFDRADTPYLNDLVEAVRERTPTRAVYPAGLWNALRGHGTWRQALPVLPFGSRWRPRLHVPILRRLVGSPRAVVFTLPDQAVLLDAFPEALIVYRLHDDYAHYHWPAAVLERWESRLVRRAGLVVAVSKGIGQALAERYGLDAALVKVSPNAVPARFVSGTGPPAQRELPEPAARLRRPVAGVLGRVSSRLRLDWLCHVVETLPWLSWVFVGDVEKGELLDEDRPRLAWLQHHERCCFTGWRPYRTLIEWASALDVAVMPLSPRSINERASPMRLFVHLAAGRPLLATPGCGQVEGFAPQVRTCRGRDELVEALESLRATGFDDGLGPTRWEAARQNTWDERARDLVAWIDEASQACARPR